MAEEEITPVRLEDRESSEPEPGLLRQVLAFNENLMLVKHRMESGWVGARHSHPHEQMVYVIRGHLQFTAGAMTFDAYSGDSFVVPGGVEHQARALEASEVLDVFSPCREDYVKS
jgi:quercetin dioxygenase-like cupin family protein